ncbi:Pancreatic progenitor cell differentiation and proliferation factor-like protein [Camelus dromedarius]|uniref:Pancreatic progenitor cell differentiation and proliferation factor-like protein n=3 Tax=Camelus TaxID=9836 RepID=A0A5N4CCK2_CAMDR|nr:Pancreatic progenitor cell differentiation and proliferation factor-like protein [Camelus dromedarius]
MKLKLKPSLGCRKDKGLGEMHAVLLAEHKIQTETDRLLHLIGPSLPAGWPHAQLCLFPAQVSGLQTEGVLGSRPAQSLQGSQPVPGTAGQLGQRLRLEDALEPGLPSGTNWRKHADDAAIALLVAVRLAPARGAMASVPSIGCLLARNQYYRKASVSSAASESVSFTDDDKAQQGRPEVAGPTRWFRSFFQPESVQSDVEREGPAAVPSESK